MDIFNLILGVLVFLLGSYFLYIGIVNLLRLRRDETLGVSILMIGCGVVNIAAGYKFMIECPIF